MGSKKAEHIRMIFKRFQMQGKYSLTFYLSKNLSFHFKYIHFQNHLPTFAYPEEIYTDVKKEKLHRNVG